MLALVRADSPTAAAESLSLLWHSSSACPNSSWLLAKYLSASRYLVLALCTASSRFSSASTPWALTATCKQSEG